MKILVTGSSGHLGEGLMRRLPEHGHEPVGIDILPSATTHHVGSITDRALVDACLQGCSAIIHTATLHKPHVATHSKQDFVDTNISGTLTLLEAAVAAGVPDVLFTSTTSAFGAALNPPDSAPAAWIDETVPSVPKNIYGATKTAAEDLCHLFYRKHGLNVLVLRTSRFFPEEDDNANTRADFSDENSKANEFLFRRVDLEDAVDAHIAALNCASGIGFDRYIISATSPFTRADLTRLRVNTGEVVAERYPDFPDVYDERGYSMFPSIDRVYANDKARAELGWRPKFDFAHVLYQIARSEPIGSDLARQIGSKGYHDEVFEHGPFPVE